MASKKKVQTNQETAGAAPGSPALLAHVHTPSPVPLPPSDNWLAELRRDLQRLEEGAGLRRLRPLEQQGKTVRLDGRTLLNLAGNDYLGLSTHPHLVEAACRAIRASGTGAGASRLVSGHITLTAEVERRFAAFKHAEAALICPTGYMANLAVMTALAGPGDLVCLDKLSHASLIDAARASGAQVRSFPHLHIGKLRGCWSGTNFPNRRRKSPRNCPIFSTRLLKNLTSHRNPTEQSEYRLIRGLGAKVIQRAQIRNPKSEIRHSPTASPAASS